MNGAEAIIESLKREKVELVFGYPGGAVLTLYDAIYQTKFPHILTRHEQGAVHAADGYARITGKVGVCFATSGPGATNLVTGIATAYMDSIPLVCITGQVGTSLIGKDSFQEADMSGITTPITKHNYLVKRVEDLPRVLKEAFFIASTGRPGPVVVDVAKDVFAAELDYEYPESVQLKGYKGLFLGDSEEIEAASQAMQLARKPIIFVGGGVVLADMAEEIRSFIKKTGIPVVSSLMGMGVMPSKDDCFLGMVGMHGTYAANMAVMQSDLLIGIGVRFDDRVTGIVEQFAPKAKKIHFDVDAAEINKNVVVDYRVCGDIRRTLPIFCKKVLRIKQDWRSHFLPWRTYLDKMKNRYPLTYEAQDGTILAQEVIEMISEYAKDDAIIVTDVGQHQMWTAQFYNFRHSRSFLTSGGLGTMGYGLPAAIGAKLAQPHRQVILFTGDGSLMMNCQELVTAADNNVDIKIVLLNNGVLGMVSQWQRMFYGERYSQSTLTTKLDFIKLAEAMGINGMRVTEPDQLEEAIQRMFAAEGAYLMEVVVPPKENVLPMVAAGKALNEMVLEAEE
ncbi:MAG: biosynthetic-type acetolactate synthase large subunit [Selenomonadales bacterium]|nr:biosynthetic-type acetolactate synthase large subunit [Selenomonadales bacterium]